MGEERVLRRENDLRMWGDVSMLRSKHKRPLSSPPVHHVVWVGEVKKTPVVPSDSAYAVDIATRLDKFYPSDRARPGPPVSPSRRSALALEELDNMDVNMDIGGGPKKTNRSFLNLLGGSTTLDELRGAVKYGDRSFPTLKTWRDFYNVLNYGPVLAAESGETPSAQVLQVSEELVSRQLPQKLRREEEALAALVHDASSRMPPRVRREPKYLQLMLPDSARMRRLLKNPRKNYHQQQMEAY